MRKCQFCVGDIPDQAVKCKHCGEWLEQNKGFAKGMEQEWLEQNKGFQGSDNARAISKGMKQKELHRFVFTLLMLLNTLVLLLFGCSGSWGIGLSIFIGGFVLLLVWYYKE